MPNAIGGIVELGPLFFDFDHLKTLQAYPDWEDLFGAAEKHLNGKPRMNKKDPHSYWVIFCKGSLCAAHYLRRFSTPAEFFEFVNDFDKNTDTRAALSLLIGHEIFGYGFALACDFLKELGFPNYSKPDQYLIDIFSALGLSDKSQLHVFRAVALLADEVGETPYAVDKAFWLIGSGKFYKDNMTFDTSKDDFLRQVKVSRTKVEEIPTNG